MIDARGSLFKISQEPFKECFYSVSKRGVIRGMHLQKGTSKVIFVMRGTALDVVVDKDGNYTERILYPESGPITIPEDYYHGFLALEDNTTMMYLQSELYDPAKERGIRYDSFDFNWPIENPILSERDRNL